MAVDIRTQKIRFVQPEKSVLDTITIDEDIKETIIEIVDEKTSPEFTTDIICRKNSRVQYVCAFLDAKAGELKNKRSITIEDGAELTSTYFYFCGGVCEAHNHFCIHERARVNHEVLFFANGRQIFNIQENFEFQKPGSFGRFMVRGLTANEAESKYVGNIVINPGAQKTDSHLEIHSFILGTRAKSQMVPQLQIEANNVKAGHAATLSRLDDEQLFYLRSRGLKKNEAAQLFIEGIFYDAVMKIQDQKTVHRIMDIVRKKYSTL